MRENHTKRLLREGKAAVGAWVCSQDPMITELVADCGLDFVVIDTEHSTQTRETVQNHMMALKDTQATPVVRVLWNDFVRVKTHLDAGAQGLVFPWVSTAEQAEQAVAATRYPPHGVRGFGPRRAQRYADDLKDYYENAGDNILVLCQIETPEAVENAEAIARVDGVDALMIGPSDLSINLGVPLDLDCETLTRAVRRVRQATDAAGSAFGVITTGAELAKRWLAEGARVIIAGADVSLLKTAYAATHDEIRQAMMRDA